VPPNEEGSDAAEVVISAAFRSLRSFPGSGGLLWTDSPRSDTMARQALDAAEAGAAPSYQTAKLIL